MLKTFCCTNFLHYLCNVLNETQELFDILKHQTTRRNDMNAFIYIGTGIVARCGEHETTAAGVTDLQTIREHVCERFPLLPHSYYKVFILTG